MVFVELFFPNCIVEERGLLCHLPVLWTCQVEAAQIQLLVRASLPVLDAPPLLIQSYKLVYEVIRIVACFALLHRHRCSSEAVWFRWPSWQNVGLELGLLWHWISR